MVRIDTRLTSDAAIREKLSTDYQRLRPGPGRSPEKVRANQRARIHRAILELATQCGRDGITVRNLTKLAGVSTASFYALFDGVDDCLLSASESVIQSVCDRIMAERSFRAPLKVRCDKVVRALFDGLTVDPFAGRLAMLEVSAGGPAALGLITSQETALEHALRVGVSRRGSSASTTAVSWVAGGALHTARAELMETSLGGRIDTSHSLLDWAEKCLAEPKPKLPPFRSTLRLSSGSNQRVEPGDDFRDESAMLKAAVQRLALKSGYWSLSESQISKAAGVPMTRFRRYFRNVDDAYLDGLDDLARRLFEPLAIDYEPGDWTFSVCWQLSSVVELALREEGAARLVLSQILAAGIDGATRRERLIDDLAASWNSTLPKMARVASNRTRTAVAGLWATLARATEIGNAQELRRSVPTYSYLALVPMVGPSAASKTIHNAFFGRN
jgi:AcrR family transcriptional regulator